MRESDQKWQGVRFIAVLMRFIEAPMVIDDAFPCALYHKRLNGVFAAKMPTDRQCYLALFSLKCGCTAFIPGDKLLVFPVVLAIRGTAVLLSWVWSFVTSRTLL